MPSVLRGVAVTKYYKLSCLSSSNVSPPVLVARSCRQVSTLRSCETESVSHLSPDFWGFAGNLCHFLACRSIAPLSAFTSTSCSPRGPSLCVQISSYENSGRIGAGAGLLQHALILRNDIKDRPISK